MQHIP
jgi:hypothetical protein